MPLYRASRSRGVGGPLSGFRWIGGEHKVPGGEGLLGAAFGGQEPAGRMLFPDSKMKLVIETNETNDEVDMSIYLKVCAGLAGCTPHVIGPIPYGTYYANEELPLGYSTVPENPPEIAIPPEIQAQIDEIERKYGGAATAPGSSGCVNEVLARTPPFLLAEGEALVPQVLEQAQEANLTSSQTAYLLATAVHDSGFKEVNNSETLLASAYDSDYYPRGLVGLQGEENYQIWSDRLGEDLVSDPDLASVHSVDILVQGSVDGTFTGQKLGDFINEEQTDFFGARQVFGGDDAELVAHYADQYQVALDNCASIGGGCADGGQMIQPSSGPVTSEFGWRRHPVLGTSRFHSGTDIGSPHGTPIVASDCGKVVFAGVEGGYGNSVVLEHSTGIYTRYAHQSRLGVSVGQVVERGTQIGAVGSTGLSTGPHLHFEVRQGGPSGEPVDPRGYVAL